MKACLALADKGALPSQDITVVFVCFVFPAPVPLPEAASREHSLGPGVSLPAQEISAQPVIFLCRLEKALIISELVRIWRLGVTLSNSFGAEHLNLEPAYRIRRCGLCVPSGSLQLSMCAHANIRHDLTIQSK